MDARDNVKQQLDEVEHDIRNKRNCSANYKIDWSRIASYFAIITSRKVFIARALKLKMAASRLATFMTGRKTYLRISRGNRELLKERSFHPVMPRGTRAAYFFESCSILTSS